jgi:hypothetical protein
MKDVKVDWSGSGLIVYVMEDQMVTHHYSSIADNSGHFTEPIIGAMARKITELETHLEAVMSSVEHLMLETEVTYDCSQHPTETCEYCTAAEALQSLVADIRHGE